MTKQKTTPPVTAIILAAGKGTRMQSALPKVMHKIAGFPMVAHVVHTARAAGISSITLVVAPGMESTVPKACPETAQSQVAVQTKQLGTGDAVRAALPMLKGFKGTVLVLYGDTPLITPASLQMLLAQKKKHNATIALFGIHLDDPTGYGRLVMKKEPYVERIVECKDATAAQKKIPWGWGGVMAFDAAFLHRALAKLKPSPVTKEYYLTALLEMAHAEKLRSVMVPVLADEAMGVNSRSELAVAEAIFQHRARGQHMDAGATLIDPDAVYFAADTVLGRDVLIEPGVFFGPGVRVESGAHIKAFSHIEGAVIGANTTVGPFARLRPGTTLGADVKVGSFVELKKAAIDEGVNISHLSYIGDATVGENTNIGGGTITCNYDGYHKHQTTIGREAFVGSNTALVAPVTIGDGAMIAAGSTITENVAADALALGRSRQNEKPGWAKNFHTHQAKKTTSP